MRLPYLPIARSRTEGAEPPARVSARPGRVAVASRLLAVFAALSIAFLGLFLLARARAGVSAVYSVPGTLSVAVVDPTISTSAIRDNVERFDLAWFDVRWTTLLSIDEKAAYEIGVGSDGEVAVRIDTVPLVSVGPQGAPDARANVTLRPGRHVLTVVYSHRRRVPARCDLTFGREGSRLHPISPSRLSTSPPSAARLRLAPALDAVAPYLALAWTCLALAGALGLAAFSFGRWLRQNGFDLAEDRAVLVPLTVAGLLFVVGIGWGLPSFAGWASDEISTPEMFGGLRSAFSGGWFSKYPPLHYYVLAVVEAPLYVASRVGLLERDAMATLSAGVLMARLVSVAMGLAAILLVYVTACVEHGRRAALASAAIVAVALPFTYYSKTANLDVPYTFWLLLSLVFYVRVWDRGRAVDSHLFAVAATLAVCTKDQAYGFYVLPGIAVGLRLAYLRAQQAPAGRRARAAASGLAIALLSGVVALAVFALVQNVAFNWKGFWLHVAMVQGMGHAYTGMFPNTVIGQAGMLLAAAGQLGTSVGWPLLALCLAGIVIELRGARRLRALWLLLPAISYYVFFIAVVRYHYDRFFIALCPILALFGGRAIAALVPAATAPAGWRRRAAVAVVAVSFAYSLVVCAALDQLMVLDSRYDAERWLRQHVKPTELVGVAWPQFEYLPRMQDFRVVRLDTPDNLRYVQPALVLLNAEHVTRFPADSEQRRLLTVLRSGTAGYRLVYRYKARPWGNPLVHFGTMSDERQDPLTNLDKINPTLEIYRQDATK